MCTLQTPHRYVVGNVSSDAYLHEFKRRVLYSMGTRFLESFVIVAETRGSWVQLPPGAPLFKGLERKTRSSFPVGEPCGPSAS